MNKTHSISEAAKILHVDRTTLQNWIRKGAPTVRPGEVGRGRGATVDIEAVRKWRYGELTSAALDVDSLSDAMWAGFCKPAAGCHAPAWAELGMERRLAAAYSVMLFAELVRALTGKPMSRDELPPQMRELFRISLS